QWPAGADLASPGIVAGAEKTHPTPDNIQQKCLKSAQVRSSRHADAAERCKLPISAHKFHNQPIYLQVYNYIAQRANKINIETARDSKSIAVASKRDSASMKTLSILTMVFLPGTFIAVRFSFPS